MFGFVHRKFPYSGNFVCKNGKCLLSGNIFIPNLPKAGKTGWTFPYENGRIAFSWTFLCEKRVCSAFSEHAKDRGFPHPRPRVFPAPA
jgi:hypothetical protein